MYYSGSKGQTLIEVVAALGIAIIVISAITIIIISSLSNSQFSRDQHAATQYAQEGMERVRLIRDTNYASFTTYAATSQPYCMGTDKTLVAKDTAVVFGCTPQGSSNNQNVANFARQITFERDSSYCSYENPPAPTPAVLTANGTKVTVAVSWRDGKCTGGDFCHIVKVVSCFSDFVVLPTPGVNP